MVYIAGAFLGTAIVSGLRSHSLPGSSHVPIDMRVLAVCVALGALWGGIQTIPGSSFLLAEGDAFMALWQENGLVSAQDLPISLNPTVSLKATGALLAHALLFFMIFMSMRSIDQARKLSHVIGAIVALYAAFSLVSFWLVPENILWFKKPTDPKALSGTFVNRNNYAAYASQGLILMLACCARYFAGSQIRSPYQYFAARFLQWGWLLALGISVLFLSILLSGSRGALLSVAVGIAAFLLLSVKFASRKAVFWTVGLLVLLLGGHFSLSGAFVSERFMVEGGASDRLELYKGMVDVLQERPLTGYGSIEELFRLYREPEMASYYRRGHNDILELFVVFGIPAGITLLTPVVFVLRRIFVAINSLGADRHFAIGGIACSATIFSHALVDFPFQIPAVSYFFTTLLAVFYSMACLSRR